ncbi:Angiomotin-like protein 1 [Galemys pyrenaicus]|uniref:Angiomotin-like protein 1 n=1 Tax=Galemys pyrenaicus TaxID=202257 RepID=A0A8J6DWG9_GALPY|nr:Angiomotin-like protein 1 [Galemys pyrenaicus]
MRGDPPGAIGPEGHAVSRSLGLVPGQGQAVLAVAEPQTQVVPAAGPMQEPGLPVSGLGVTLSRGAAARSGVLAPAPAPAPACWCQNWPRGGICAWWPALTGVLWTSGPGEGGIRRSGLPTAGHSPGGPVRALEDPSCCSLGLQLGPGRQDAATAEAGGGLRDRVVEAPRRELPAAPRVDMRGPEEAAAGTVLQRLIQEQLRHGGPAENMSLRAAQRQAAGSAGPARPAAGLASAESPPQEGPPMVHAARQEPQGEEHQADGAAMEQQARAPQPAPGGEELPSYEEAKAQSQFFRGPPPAALGPGYLPAGGGQKARSEGRPARGRAAGGQALRDEALRELRQGHVRSLSERLLQLSLGRAGPPPPPAAGPTARGPRGPPPEYPFKAKPLPAPVSAPQEHGLLFADQHPGLLRDPGKAYPGPQPARTEVAALHRQPPPEYGVTSRPCQLPFPATVRPHSPAPSPASSAGGPLHPAPLRLPVALGAPPAAAPSQQLGPDAFAIVERAQQMVAVLTGENRALHQELRGQQDNADKLHKFERELQRISDAYESLVASTSKREALDKAMRNRLEGEIRRLHDFNRDLRGTCPPPRPRPGPRLPGPRGQAQPAPARLSFLVPSTTAASGQDVAPSGQYRLETASRQLSGHEDRAAEGLFACQSESGRLGGCRAGRRCPPCAPPCPGPRGPRPPPLWGSHRPDARGSGVPESTSVTGPCRHCSGLVCRRCPVRGGGRRVQTPSRLRPRAQPEAWAPGPRGRLSAQTLPPAASGQMRGRHPCASLWTLRARRPGAQGLSRAPADKEFLREKEELELELAAVRTAGEEHRRHIEVLDQALSRAQARVVRLEEELREKQASVEKVEKLQQALAQLQAACEKREQMEQRLRAWLERELDALRAQQKHGASRPASVPEHSVPALVELVREKEERILALEASTARWEQKCLQESAMRHFAVGAAATCESRGPGAAVPPPCAAFRRMALRLCCASGRRDAPLAAHFRHGSDGESSPEAHAWPEEEEAQAARRCQDVEFTIKDLHAKIIGKAAVVKALQQRARRDTARDAASLRPARSVPSVAVAAGAHSRQPSLTGGQPEEKREEETWAGSGGLLPGRELPERACTPACTPAAPASAAHAKTGSRDSGTQTDRASELFWPHAASLPGRGRLSGPPPSSPALKLHLAKEGAPGPRRPPEHRGRAGGQPARAKPPEGDVLEVLI